MFLSMFVVICLFFQEFIAGHRCFNWANCNECNGCRKHYGVEKWKVLKKACLDDIDCIFSVL